MGKAKNPQKALAFQFFIAGKTNKDIAEKVGVTEHTIGRWASEEKWDGLQLANSTRIQSLVKRFEDAIEKQLEIIETLQEENKPITKETDALVKLVNSKDKMETSLPLSAYVQVLEDFMNAIENPKIKREVAEAQRKFLTDKASGL